MPRDSVSRTAHVGTVVNNGLTFVQFPPPDGEESAAAVQSSSSQHGDARPLIVAVLLANKEVLSMLAIAVKEVLSLLMMTKKEVLSMLAMANKEVLSILAMVNKEVISTVAHLWRCSCHTSLMAARRLHLLISQLPHSHLYR